MVQIAGRDVGPSQGGAAPVIEAVDLTKRYGELEAVKSVSFSVEPGETYGFLGPNGAGKSTTISMLCTLVRPTAGTATVAGFDVVRRRTEVRRQIGLVFQDTTLDDYLTGAENLRFHAELYRVPKEELDDRMHRVMEMVGLWDRRNSIVKTYSGGMKRRLEIARGLLHSPRVLFLDEPTVGLDPQTRSHIWGYINELKRRESITMFLTTHYMDEAEHCDRIAIMDNGELVVVDTPEALKRSVGRDRVSITSENDEAAMRVLAERFDLEPTISEGAITFFVAHGEQFVPRLFADPDITINSVHVARPTLDDVFMTYTGRTIRDAEASGAERNRANPWVRSSRGR